MTTLKEAAAQALDALTKIHPGNMSWETGEAWLNAVQILREALAQTEREPLTDEEIVDIVGNCAADSGGWFRYHAFARAIERAHGIGEKE